MKKLLLVIDMQNDFITGSLGTPEAIAIVPNVVNKINDWDGDIISTRDTHFHNYLETNEGKHLPMRLLRSVLNAGFQKNLFTKHPRMAYAV